MKGIVVGSSLIKYATGPRILPSGDVCTFSFPGGMVPDTRLLMEDVSRCDFVIIQIGTNDVFNGSRRWTRNSPS